MVCKTVRKTPIDSGLKKLHDYLKAEDLLAVPFEKSCGVCVICAFQKSTYKKNSKMCQRLISSKKNNGAKDEIKIKTEKQINNIIQLLMKQGKISGKICQDQLANKQ